jgi:hypothetical protein
MNSTACGTYGEEKEMRIGVWWGKLQGMRPLEIPRPAFEDRIKVDRKEMRCEGVDRIELALDRDKRLFVVNTVVKFWVS